MPITKVTFACGICYKEELNIHKFHWLKKPICRWCLSVLWQKLGFLTLLTYPSVDDVYYHTGLIESFFNMNADVNGNFTLSSWSSSWVFETCLDKNVACWQWQPIITETKFATADQLFKVINEKCKKAQGRVLFSDSKKSSSVHPRLEGNWTVAHKADKFMEWYSPSVKGGVANGKHYGLVMTT